MHAISAGQDCKKFVEDSLAIEDLDYAVFSKVSPRSDEVMKGAEIYNREQCDAIVALGGGSPMDCAKGIGIVTSNPGYILDYEGVDLIPNPLPPMIPSTAGSKITDIHALEALRLLSLNLPRAIESTGPYIFFFVSDNGIGMNRDQNI
jgi:alcohol dehydrogenase class IV